MVGILERISWIISLELSPLAQTLLGALTLHRSARSAQDEAFAAAYAELGQMVGSRRRRGEQADDEAIEAAAVELEEQGLLERTRLSRADGRRAPYAWKVRYLKSESQLRWPAAAKAWAWMFAFRGEQHPGPYALAAFARLCRAADANGVVGPLPEKMLGYRSPDEESVLDLHRRNVVATLDALAAVPGALSYTIDREQRPMLFTIQLGVPEITMDAEGFAAPPVPIDAPARGSSSIERIRSRYPLTLEAFDLAVEELWPGGTTKMMASAAELFEEREGWQLKQAQMLEEFIYPVVRAQRTYGMEQAALVKQALDVLINAISRGVQFREGPGAYYTGTVRRLAGRQQERPALVVVPEPEPVPEPSYDELVAELLAS